MGGSSSRSRAVYVQRTVYVERVDTCRPPIIELANEQMNDAARAYSQCVDTATSNAWTKMYQQKNQLNTAINQALIDSNKRMQNRLHADAKFCYNIEKNYKPFGIRGPEELQCDMVEESTFGCRLENSDEYDDSCELGQEELSSGGL